MFCRLLFLVVITFSPTLLWAAPALKPIKPDYPKLAGTKWLGKTFEGQEMVLEFLPEGGMKVTYGGSSFTTASWKQTEDKIYWEMNNKYCEFDGKVVGDTIDGKSHNVTKKEWITTMKRLKSE